MCIRDSLYTVLYALIPGYFYTAFLYGVLTLLAVRGLIVWRRKMNHESDQL